MHQYHHQISSTIVPETHVKIHQHKNAGEYIGFIDLGFMTYKFRKSCLAKISHDPCKMFCFINHLKIDDRYVYVRE